MHHENKRNSFYHNARLAERTKLQQRCYDAMMFCLTNTVHLMLVNSICSQKKKSQQKIYLKNSYHTGSHRYTYTHTHTLTRHMSYWVTVDINTPAYIIWVVHKIKRLWLQGLGGGVLFSSLLSVAQTRALDFCNHPRKRMDHRRRRRRRSSSSPVNVKEKPHLCEKAIGIQ